MKRGKAKKLREVIEQASSSLPDEDALEAVELFPAWASGIEYAVDTRVRHGSLLYRCIQAHTSQDDWTPDAAPSLFVRVAAPGTIPEWVQPAGAHDAYNKGDQVRHADKVWESLVDANVWEPGAPGTETLWKEKSE